jgi:hypothetical protein
MRSSKLDYPRASFAAVRESASCAPFDGSPRCNVAVAIGGEPDMQMVARGDHIGADDPMRYESKSRSERPAAVLGAILEQKHGKAPTPPVSIQNDSGRPKDFPAMPRQTEHAARLLSWEVSP